jgi:hypothetical protein
MVVSICRITEDGDVSEVSLSVVSSLSRTKVVVPLTQIFPDAPEGWVMVFNCDLKQFMFAPSMMGSFWVQASRLGLKFYSAYAVGAGANSQTPCTIAEQSTHNLTDFQVRLCIKPMEDGKVAEACLVALPVTTVAMSSLLSPEVAREGLGYPVILLFDLTQQQVMTVGPRPRADAESFGLPCHPVLWMSPDAMEPKSADILTSVLAMWSTATTPRLVAPEEFQQATGINPVHASEVPAEWCWPPSPAPALQLERHGEFFLDLFISPD